ncbi:hypothetical protein XELAEV_18000567mg [Xenopus laevis]|nr:hypothetical protein XELAEV_18000567mg [Xenopus laevis]
MNQNNLLKQQQLHQQRNHSLLRLLNTNGDSSEVKPGNLTNPNSCSMLNASGSGTYKRGVPELGGGLFPGKAC